MKLTVYVPDDVLFYKGVNKDLTSPQQDARLTYTPGTKVKADTLDRDPTKDCAAGINFCRTLAEALKWGKEGTVVTIKPIGGIVDTGGKLRAAAVEVVSVVNLISWPTSHGANLSGANLSSANLLSGQPLRRRPPRRQPPQRQPPQRQPHRRQPPQRRPLCADLYRRQPQLRQPLRRQPQQRQPPQRQPLRRQPPQGQPLRRQPPRRQPHRRQPPRRQPHSRAGESTSEQCSPTGNQSPGPGC